MRSAHEQLHGASHVFLVRGGTTFIRVTSALACAASLCMCPCQRDIDALPQGVPKIPVEEGISGNIVFASLKLSPCEGEIVERVY